MNGFEKRASLIKEKIMRTTLDMLRTSELKRIRIADISKAAKVSQVTIYNYFGSKEELLREVFRNYFDQAIRDFEQYMSEGHSLKEKIEHIIFLEKESYNDFPPGLIKELLIDDEELSRYMEEQYRNKAIPLTVQIIQEGKESGEISPDVSTEHVLAFIQLFMNQYESILAMAQQSDDRDGFLEGMVHMFFYGVCGKA
ncbi:TetR/AcrR family transcriptional regulator [Paenibacillus lautus]|jgi:AcrR family transcriptional regulator|uniref:TetR/AcrR family transcriptional regulator n=1 Tax=Paenibacillus lautus TaxID=1401 RepID=A0A385TUD5_PAELA|nr:TetR/AcrR family transcriptional regulator [Paenibacillus lautus]AYB47419.1 TetR/AcrR family transcriptional regulator [Paenibacillus lautus]MCI1774501.1 TetR/AcrR family transcriptional regulator [Paenibacillus lautus]VTR50617.1 HTH-type dhaKLM operon transcriptional activator dhaS [Actinobacillus pleuropneumoniae]